ncbi:sex-determining protein, putative [Trichomonas vaginalis G3]|uniref:Sex-determining protein, putative n=1 Tax=Trichomonas vaginalis (strain ATCC PRA-98 / G3) TaxID=412133 RepID=A2G5A4_TRIV3|nr:spectrin binding [Trichomonas vaginalis G3]EAX87669.1 sex-determining protein, putative [Trichomonas vaginalis G3]KAI5518799.1 spectrin binding [Trichomonas vaginalis G3]|eukprot:XP_001300599.1 sex-determining protein [Trichomonas vaginalis G3]
MKSNGETPLFIASQKGHLEVVEYLISIGANKEAKNKDGYTPLICASENGRLEVVKYLISAGADKEAKNNDGETALIKASIRGYRKPIIDYLITAGADKEAKDNNGHTYQYYQEHPVWPKGKFYVVQKVEKMWSDENKVVD